MTVQVFDFHQAAHTFYSLHFPQVLAHIMLRAAHAGGAGSNGAAGHPQPKGAAAAAAGATHEAAFCCAAAAVGRAVVIELTRSEQQQQGQQQSQQGLASSFLSAAFARAAQGNLCTCFLSPVMILHDGVVVLPAKPSVQLARGAGSISQLLFYSVLLLQA
jgi:hypothetical protein